MLRSVAAGSAVKECALSGALTGNGTPLRFLTILMMLTVIMFSAWSSAMLIEARFTNYVDGHLRE